MPTLDEYVAARSAFVRQNEALDKMAAEVEGVGNAMRNSRNRFMFANAGGLPGAAALNPRMITADANHWKTGHQINEELADWHVKREALISIWRNLTADQKASLQAPPREAMSNH